MTKKDGPLRVLVVADAKPAKGGISTYAHTLVEDCFRSGEIRLELLNTTRTSEWKGGALSLSNLRRGLVDPVRLLLRARRTDVVHLQTALLPLLPLTRALALVAAARLARRPVLVHVHTGQVNAGAHERFEPGAVTRFLLRGLRWASRIIVVSEAGRRGLERFVPPEKMVRIDNAVRTSDWPAPEPEEPPLVLYAGAINRGKGLLDLAAAVTRLRAANMDDWSLEVVGGSNQTGDVEAETVVNAFESAGLGDVFLGAVDPDSMRGHYRRAAIFVMPSYSEGQPISILEALAAGVPVVATAVGAVPEIVVHNHTGLVVPPGAPEELARALQTLIQDPTLRVRMSEAARRLVEERYDVAMMEEKLAELYWKLAPADR